MKAYSDRPTDHLKELQRRVPLVGDKALIDLVSGIQVSGDIIRYRKSRGFLGRILDSLDGIDHQRQILLDGNLIAGQQALCDWVLEINDSLRISQVALEVTQNSLLEARAAIRNQRQELTSLRQKLNYLAQEINTKLKTLESRVRRLELQVAANEDFDQIVTAWTARQTYANFSWVVQVALLIREVFSSSVCLYELETRDRTSFRQLLVNKILIESRQMPEMFFGLAELLNQSFLGMTEDTRNLAAELLEIRSIPSNRLQNTPYLFTLGATLELATLPEETKPNKSAQCAIELCRNQIDLIPYTTDTREFVTRLVEETANDCLAIMTRRTTHASF